MKELLTLLCDCLEEGRPVALASVISHEGSTPRGAGSRLLADAAGLVAGTVGGGLAEGRTLEACRAALEDGRARILPFHLSGELAAQNGMICGGALRVLVEPLLRPAEHLPFFRAVRDSLCRDGALLVTDITDSARPLRSARMDGAPAGAPLPKGVMDHILASVPPGQEAALCALGQRNYFVEICLPPLRMVIAGGGHVAQPTAQLAALTGFAVTVLDDRPEFSQPERFPWAARVATVPDYARCFADCAPDARTYIVIVTRGHLHDATVLAQALDTRAGYIGMIGSRRKRDELYKTLRAQGLGEEALARVCCPVGLDIGAETPEEIAVSIVAQCIAHRRKACPVRPLPR